MQPANTSPIPPLTTRPELARMLRVSLTQFDRLKKAGALPPAVRIGGRDRWAAADVAAWLAERGRK